MSLPGRLVPSLALVACITSLATAEPLDLTRVSAKSVWMIHADIDAARESIVMNRLVERVIKKYPQFEGMQSMWGKMVGMDIRKDLHDVTVYGLDTDKKNAVMIVHANVNRQFLEKMVEKARDHETLKHRDYTLHKWTHKGWKGRAGEPVVGGFYKDNVMVFARSADRVEMAIDVLDGKAESVAADSPLAGRTRPGSILVGRASEIDPDTDCPVLRQGEGFRVAVGENDGKSFYRARLAMESAEAAKLAEDVVEGLAATMALGLGKQPGMSKLLAGVETMTDGKTCMIVWNAEADEVWEVAEAMAEKFEAKMAARRKQWGGQKGGCSDCGKDGCGDCEQGKCPMEKNGETERESPEEGRRPFRDDEF